MRPGDNVQQIEDARLNFKAFFEAHKDFVVLLNRQPSLHRESFQAFKPVPLPADAGDVIQLCPLACKGFAADFDGDEMVIHVPMGVAAQEDARRLLPSINLFSLATTPEGAENVLAHFDQDFVMGNWFLGRSDEAGLRRKFRAMLPGEDCHVLVDSWDHPGKKQGAELLALLVSKHRDSATRVIEQWMRIAFEACTKVGVSFGYYEFREIAEALRSQVEIKCHEQIQKIPAFTWDDARKGKNEPDYNQALADIAQLALEEVLEGPKLIGKKGAYIAAMALSGARGKKQIRQLIAARGMLEAGKTGFDPFDKGRGHFFFSQPLAVGHDADSAFWAAMNARSSMVDKKLGTGYAGGLTRSMVFALWPFEITVECCGSAADKRSPINCQQKVGCCAKCYGELPGGKLPATGFPAGLIAAQSIGERGTQLSMQSFHAGASGIDIHTVRDLLRTSANFQELEQSGQFVTFMQKADAYENILDRHFQILWRVIHDSEQKSLPSAIAGQDALTVLANRHRASSLASAVLQGARSSRNGPIAKTLLGGFRSEEQPQTPD